MRIYREFIERNWKKNTIRRVWGRMKVNLLNDGPVTIIIDTKNKE